jgi:hypothetical protein
VLESSPNLKKLCYLFICLLGWLAAVIDSVKKLNKSHGWLAITFQAEFTEKRILFNTQFFFVCSSNIEEMWY